MEIGDIRMTAVSDGEARLPAHIYFVGSTAAEWESHREMLDGDGNYIFPLGCFVIDSGEKRVLVDTGLGPVDTGFAKGGALLGSLEGEGIGPETIDTVHLTHFHIDHVGGLIDGTELCFPNAEVSLTQVELDFWRDTPPPNAVVRHDVIEAITDRMKFVEDGDTLAPGINVIALPGHTPGSSGLVLSSGDARAMLLGDAIACPVQLEESEWTSMGDVDPDLAKRTREQLWREVEGTETHVGASHFPDLKFGRVLLGEGKRYFSG